MTEERCAQGKEHDDAGCELAWEQHCDRHRRDVEKVRAELMLLRQLEDNRRQRRAMEPKHSRDDHECEECGILEELQRLRGQR